MKRPQGSPVPSVVPLVSAQIHNKPFGSFSVLCSLDEQVHPSSMESPSNA